LPVVKALVSKEDNLFSTCLRSFEPARITDLEHLGEEWLEIFFLWAETGAGSCWVLGIYRSGQNFLKSGPLRCPAGYVKH